MKLGVPTTQSPIDAKSKHKSATKKKALYCVQFGIQINCTVQTKISPSKVGIQMTLNKDYS